MTRDSSSPAHNHARLKRLISAEHSRRDQRGDPFFAIAQDLLEYILIVLSERRPRSLDTSGGTREMRPRSFHDRFAECRVIYFDEMHAVGHLRIARSLRAVLHLVCWYPTRLEMRLCRSGTPRGGPA